MQYFQTFPLVNYKMSEYTNGTLQQIIRTVPNLTVRFDVNYQEGDYEWYRITEQDRPDTLAATWYGATRYTWVVLLSNNMKDLYDWPLSELEFYNYMNRKYESTLNARDGVEISQNIVYEYRCTDIITEREIVVDETFYDTHQFNKRSISQYDYEYSLNDQRRDIRRLNTETFASFVKQFEALIGQ